MGGLLKALAKVGLVEMDNEGGVEVRPDAAAADAAVSDEAVRRILEEDDVPDLPTHGLPAESAPQRPVHTGTSGGAVAPGAPAAGPPKTAVATSGQGVSLGHTGKPFDEIYAEAGVQPSAFSAEKLLRLLDGLQAMEPAVRRAAVLAMDAADEAWTIDDAVLDAQRKVAALERADQQVQQALATAEQKATEDLAGQDKYKEQAASSIRKQIAELEALLDEELQKVATEQASIQSRVQQQRESASRERARLANAASKLQSIPATFGGAGASTAGASGSGSTAGPAGPGSPTPE